MDKGIMVKSVKKDNGIEPGATGGEVKGRTMGQRTDADNQRSLRYQTADGMKVDPVHPFA